MWPGGFNFVFCLNTGLGELKIRFLKVGEWSENVFLDHSHDIVKMWDNETDNRLLILEQLLDFVDSVKSFGLSFDVL